ncbi:MAG TPA: two-component regulator propeller domain-containing protein, partial [Rudaea sp.]|nr:two-component regulator propeller domain-containing protein [Rudaea sp.]
MAAPCAGAPTGSPTLPGHYLFRSYGPADGLTNTAVTQLLQDAYGFIWAGTDDGLYRYDGYQFELIGSEQGLPSGGIDVLYTDHRGTLWVATRGALSRSEGMGFVRLPLAMAADEAVHALADDGSRVWLATSRGLRQADQHLDVTLAAGWPGGEATAVAAPHASAVWAAQWDGVAAHVLRYEPQSASPWTRYEVVGGAAAEPIDALVEDGRGQLWARSASELWRFDGERFTIVPTPQPLSSMQGRGYLTRGKRGDLWVSTNDWLLHYDDGRWTEVLGGPMLGTRSVLEDRDGSLWFAAHGLQRLEGRGIFHAYDVAEGVPGNVVWSIARDRSGALWVGTERGFARAVGDRFETIPGTRGYTGRSIAVADDGTLYMAGAPAADVLRYDPVRRGVTHLPLGVVKAPSKILHLFIDRRGTLWLTTDSAGLFHADTHEAEPHFVPEPLPGTSGGAFLRDIAEDAAGRLWITGYNGLLVRENEQWRRLTVADGLSVNETRYVTVAHNGDLLIAYEGTHGFDRLRYDGKTLRNVLHVDAGSTRYIDEIFILREDVNGNVWAGTGRGMDRYDATGVEHFGAQQGLLGEDTASESLLAEPNGDVWFGVVGGLMRFDAAKYRAVPHRIAP